jgi:hypothetical protein
MSQRPMNTILCETLYKLTLITQRGTENYRGIETEMTSDNV